jgi:hypothetical protein
MEDDDADIFDMATNERMIVARFQGNHRICQSAASPLRPLPTTNPRCLPKAQRREPHPTTATSSGHCMERLLCCEIRVGRLLVHSHLFASWYGLSFERLERCREFRRSGGRSDSGIPVEPTAMPVTVRSYRKVVELVIGFEEFPEGGKGLHGHHLPPCCPCLRRGRSRRSTSVDSASLLYKNAFIEVADISCP